ncbi:hypothetical protein A4G19_11235 [Pasteurellaceae bacterium Macca]|nr:hypothetical protein [Pasteurellaceae bacterium Macca]
MIIYHEHVRKWEDLTKEMKNNITDKKGKNRMRYKELSPISISKFNEIVNENNVGKIVEAMISISIYSKNRKWVKEVILSSLNSQNPEIFRGAIVSLSHIARIDKNLNIEEIVRMINKNFNKILYQGEIEDLIDDIAIFQKQN